MLRQSDKQYYNLLRYANPNTGYLKFVPYDDSYIKVSDKEDIRSPEFIFDGRRKSLFFPKFPEASINQIPLYIKPGKLPVDERSLKLLRDELNVVRVGTTSGAKPDWYPVDNLPIVVSYENHDEFKIGFVATDLTNPKRPELTFMMLDEKANFPISTRINTRFGPNGKEVMTAFIPQIADGIIAWAYIDPKGIIIRPDRDKS